MNTFRTRIAVPVAIVAALVIAPSLSGCGLVSGLVNKATDGQVSLGGGKLPSDFPSDVPVIKGDVIYGLGLKGDDGKKGWNVTIKVDDANAFDTISSQLTGAGYASSGEQTSSSDAGSAGLFTNDKWTVVVAVTGDKSAGYAANYTVAPADANQ